MGDETVSRSAENRLLAAEADALLGAADLFRDFVSSAHNSGSGHSGEEGKFTENLLTQFLRRSLPTRLSVGTGFVFDQKSGRRSYQIDILVYDEAAYPVLLRYGDAVIIPWQAAVAAISVKKNLKKRDIKTEVQNLSEIGEICGGSGRKAPYLSLVAFDCSYSKHDFKKRGTRTFEGIEKGLPNRPQGYSANELIDSVIVIGEFLVKKKRWKPQDQTERRKEVPYLWTGGKEQRSVTLMHLLHGIENVLYEGIFTNETRPFNRSFPKGNMRQVGSIPVKTEDRPTRQPRAK